jgi:hypothetical protein
VPVGLAAEHDAERIDDAGDDDDDDDTREVEEEPHRDLAALDEFNALITSAKE